MNFLALWVFAAAVHEDRLLNRNIMCCRLKAFSRYENLREIFCTMKQI